VQEEKIPPETNHSLQQPSQRPLAIALGRSLLVAVHRFGAWGSFLKRLDLDVIITNNTVMQFTYHWTADANDVVRLSAFLDDS
jgi:hypothetical protein